MHVILFLLAMFVPAVCFSHTLDIEKFEIRQEKAIIPLLIGVALISVAVGIYTFLQMRKMQKKNQPKPNQLDGTIADEGVSFRDIAGSPHIHPNITEIWDKSTSAIKQKSGGFLGIGSSSTVTGYRYYAKFAAFIGNRIERFLAINFDQRKWVTHNINKHPFNMLPINEPSLFGQDAGGVAGNIDIEFGYPNPQQNATYKQHFDLVSAYPYESYLVFRGLGEVESGGGFAGGIISSMLPQYNSSFYLGNSGYMKEMLLWVKRTRVKNNGDSQWYASTESRPWVCEIGEYAASSYEIYVDGYKSRDITYFSGLGDKNPTTTYQNNFRLGPTLAKGSTSLSVEFEWASASSATFSFDIWLSTGNQPRVYTSEKIKLINVLSEKFPMTDQWDLKVKYTFEIIKTERENHWVNFGLNFYEYYDEDYYPNGKFSDFYSTGWSNIPYTSGYIANESINASPDINPVHKIREILTDETAMAKPEIYINDVNFMKAADRIWDEGLGISWAIDEKSCLDAIEELCYHIEAGVRVNRQTGLYEMVLFRDDWFAEDEIHEITENMIKDLSLEIMNSDDVVNQLNVAYYDRKRIKNSTFSVYENGSILTIGKANAESIDFPYFMNMRNAEIVANWKLKQYSTPAWKGEFTTGWREARKWNRYDLVKINWPKKWQGAILARIMLIDLGDGRDNAVRIEFEEVVPYSGEINTSIVVDDSTEEKAEPAKPAIGETFEAPYYLAVQNIGQRKVDEELAYNQDVGFTFSTYRRPQWNALYAEITTANVDKPEDGWIVDGNADFVTSGQFDQLVSRTMTQIPVKNLQIEGSLNQGDLIVVGSWIIGNVGQYEFMIIESFDAETSILTVKRGALDTIPFEWGVDTNFWNSSPDDGLFSLTEYSAGQNVRGSALTVTPSSKLEQLGSVPVYMRSRAIRPYPPANVKFNDIYYPEAIITTNDIVLTWVGRNRLANQVLDFYDASNDAELNTTYSYELISENVVLDSGSGITENTATILSSSLIPNKPHTLKLWSVRDGYDSYQTFEHSFFAESVSLILTATTNGSSVVGSANPDSNIYANVDESLYANMTVDGSSISGKAEAGATITIEIQE